MQEWVGCESIVYEVAGWKWSGRKLEPKSCNKQSLYEQGIIIIIFVIIIIIIIIIMIVSDCRPSIDWIVWVSIKDGYWEPTSQSWIILNHEEDHDHNYHDGHDDHDEDHGITIGNDHQ